MVSIIFTIFFELFEIILTTSSLFMFVYIYTVCDITYSNTFVSLIVIFTITVLVINYLSKNCYFPDIVRSVVKGINLLTFILVNLFVWYLFILTIGALYSDIIFWNERIGLSITRVICSKTELECTLNILCSVTSIELPLEKKIEILNSAKIPDDVADLLADYVVDNPGSLNFNKIFAHLLDYSGVNDPKTHIRFLSILITKIILLFL